MQSAPPPIAGLPPFDPRAITGPDPVLRTYYIICAFLTGPGVILALPLLMFKFITLKYRFDDEGIAMSWGILFRREIYLTYRRIQDIHVTRGIIQRWLGIATISVQTAAGSANAEMQVEGIIQYEALRDFLYRKMRGAHGIHEASSGTAPAGAAAIGGATSGGAAPGGGAASADEALVLLREIRDELRRARPQGSGRGA